MKKIAVNTVKAFLKEHKNEEFITETFTVGSSSFEVQIKRSLTTTEKTTFINRVLSGCFDAANNFRPEYVTPMLRATILQMCTNIPVISLKGDQGDDGGSLMDIEAMNDLYVAMDLDNYSNSHYQSMMNDIVHLCFDAIDWKKSRILSGNADAFTAFADASHAVRRLVETLADKAESADLPTLMEYAGKLTAATDNLEEGGILNGLLSLAGKSE